MRSRESSFWPAANSSSGRGSTGFRRRVSACKLTSHCFVINYLLSGSALASHLGSCHRVLGSRGRVVDGQSASMRQTAARAVGGLRQRLGLGRWHGESECSYLVNSILQLRQTIAHFDLRARLSRWQRDAPSAVGRSFSMAGRRCPTPVRPL